jgi:hypothetical protein
MLVKKLILLFVLVQVAFCMPKPQFITLRDGKIGVNFGGYHAEAGLGGLLTGNAAHGGLSASAGTPFGQRAGAGLGGTVDGQGRTVGGLYAGASANSEVGASAALGGNLDGSGGFGGRGSEAHAYGHSTKTVQLSQTPQHHVDQTSVVKEKEIIKEKGFDVRTNVNVQAPVSSVQPPAVLPSPSQHVPLDDTPLTTYSKRIHKKKFRQRLRPSHNKAVLVEKRIERPALRASNRFFATQSHNQFQQQVPSANVDYRNFLDFGFFSNAAAAFGGRASENPYTHTVYVEKELSPNNVIFHKETFTPPVQPSVIESTHSIDVSEKNSVKQVKHVSSEESSEEDTGHHVGGGIGVRSSVGAASDGHSRVDATTYTKTRQWNLGPTFFDDIFNIPISTLGAVNQFLNNKAAAANGGATVTKTVEVQHS